MSKIGNLRHRIQLQTYTEMQDSYAGTLKTWTTLMTMFAEIVSVKGYVTFQTQQIEEKTTHRITIRDPRPELIVTSELWILMESRRFRIRNVQNLFEKNRFLVLTCEEVFHAQQPFIVNSSTVGQPLEMDLPLEN
jgi:SPP1 family predicted phage head-tail adaptor